MESNNNSNESSNNIGRNKYNNNMLRQQLSRSSTQKPKNEDINLSKLITQAYHFKCKGELELNLKTNDLTWTLKGEKSQEYLKKYTKGEEKIVINKSDISKINDIDDPKSNRYLLRIIMKNAKDTSYIFSFQDKENSLNIKNKYMELLLSNDYYDYYKNEFQLLSTENQKRICLLLNNKYLNLLYRRIYSCIYNHDIEIIWIIIKFRYPEFINVNLGKNKIQLSRDEELMMLVERKYNITKLINSDSNINKNYRDIKNIKDKNYWDNFIDRQKGNNTYIVGGYKQSVCDNDDNAEEDKEKPINVIFEDLEKDKYYYDNYETNYLYHNDSMKKEIERNIPEIKLLNDYSMNKVKENNYFSYSFHCLNAYNNKGPIKNRSMRNINSSNINYGDMKVEKTENDQKCKKRLKKEQLLNIIKKMEIENDNQKKNNSFHTTMKKITKENHDKYELAKFDPSLLPLEKNLSLYINYTFLIKDLVSAYNITKSVLYYKLKKQEEKSSSSSPIKRVNYDLNMKNNYERFYKEIKSCYDLFKKKKQKDDLGRFEKIINFLLENTVVVIDRMSGYK